MVRGLEPLLEVGDEGRLEFLDVLLVLDRERESLLGVTSPDEVVDACPDGGRVDDLSQRCQLRSSEKA